MKFLKVIGKFFAFIFSIVFFALLLGSIAILFTKNLFEEETLNSYIKESSIYTLPAVDITGKENDTLKVALGNQLEKYGVQANLIDEIENNGKVEELMARISSKYIRYILFDEEKPQLVSSDIYSILNVEMIETYGNRILTLNEKEGYNEFVNEAVETINNSIPNKEELGLDDMTYAKIVIDYVYSDNFNYILIANLALIFILICVLTWSLYKPFAFLGVPTIITGCILMVIHLVQKIALNYLINAGGFVEQFSKNFINVVTKHLFILGLIVLAIGVIMLIINTVTSKIINKKKMEQTLKLKTSKKHPKKEETEKIESI